MQKARDFTYKDRDAGHKELFSMLIYRPFANFLLNRIFRHINISPSIISLISLATIVASACFFAFYNYPYLLIGILLLHLGYALDTLDGQYARYKGLSSVYGRWFDPFTDVIKAVFLFMSLSYRAYMTEMDHTAYLWGMAALVHCFLTFWIMNTRGQIIKEPTFEIKLKKGIYIGYEISLYWIIGLIVLLNKPYAGLVFLATVGAFSWIKIYITLRRYYYKNRDKVEETKYGY